MFIKFNRKKKADDNCEDYTDSLDTMFKLVLEVEKARQKDIKFKENKENQKKLDRLYSSLQTALSGQEVKVTKNEPTHEEELSSIHNDGSVLVVGNTIVIHTKDRNFLAFADVADVMPTVNGDVRMEFTISDFDEEVK